MKHSRIFNFLIELLISIVIFTIAMIGIVMIFDKSSNINHKTNLLNEVHNTYISVIEKMRIYNGEDLDVYLKEYNLDKNYINLEYDKDSLSYYIMIEYNDEILAKTRVYVGEIYE